MEKLEIKMNSLWTTSGLRFRRLLDAYDIHYAEDGEDPLDRRMLDLLEAMHMDAQRLQRNIFGLAIFAAVGLGLLTGRILFG